MEKPGLEASCSVIGGCHICGILTTSNKDLQMYAAACIAGSHPQSMHEVASCAAGCLKVGSQDRLDNLQI